MFRSIIFGVIYFIEIEMGSHLDLTTNINNSDTLSSGSNVNISTNPYGQQEANGQGLAKVCEGEPERSECMTHEVNIEEPTLNNELFTVHDKWHDLWSEHVDVPLGLSKRQQKKYIRRVLWETKWKPLRRAKEKEKLKQKKLIAQASNEKLGPSRKKLKYSTMASSKCKLRICLDFSFDELMSEKDLGKCLKQLNHCYCLNRRAIYPLQLHVTSFCGTARDQLARGVAYKNWDLNFHEENYLNIFKKEELVYLTSESDNILTHVDHNKVYIIGALVDHNKYKGKTLQIALNQGIDHAQLPISDYLQMNSRKVLTIDHVFEILIYASEGVSWKESLLQVIPQRKGATEIITTTIQKN